MPSQGPLSPSTGVSDSSNGGTDSWTNPGNVTASDDTRAQTNGTTGTTHYLKATGFGFSIPSTATVDGVVVEWERHGFNADRGQDVEIKLVKADVVVGNNKADTSSFWPTSDAYASYGSSTDLWGTTWTPAEINGSTFGAVLSGGRPGVGTSLRVDHIRITVHYTEAPSAQIVMMP